jgi:phospholipase/carboxylesterase
MEASGRLQARPGQARSAPVIQPCVTGLQRLDVGGQRDSYVFVPASAAAAPDCPAPLVLLLHGAGGHAHDGLRVLLHLAEDAGLLLLAPASQAATWDLIARRGYGPDRDLADRALEQVFARHAIDRARVGIGGFSDGASYALSLGLANGDLFTHVLAFSPGFASPGTARGAPRVFMSHGTHDHVLPIDPCSRTIDRRLRAAGYDLTYREFEGEHVIPPAIAAEAVAWFSG